jgi:acyl carrier protein
MDAAAVAFSERGKLPVVTIDWDAWQADRWQERTLTQLPELREQFKRWRAEFGIRAEEGLEVLERVLGSGLRRVVVSPRDVSEAIAAHDMMARSVLGQERRTDTPTAPATGADLSATEERVIAIWRDVLGVTAPDPNASVLDLGGHSLMMLQVVARLKQEFQIEVPVRALFDNPTVAGLAAFLDGLLRTPQASEDADEPNDLARLLAEVEQLTPEEVSAELSAIEGEIANGVRP